jgi:hypothetical protein
LIFKEYASKEYVKEHINNLTAEDIGAIPTPTTAEVGQTIRVSAVDENGVPTAWEAVDMKDSGSEWEVINEITTTEEVASLTISTDLDNNAFDLAEIQVNIAFPIYESANETLWYLYFAPNTLNFATSSFMSGCKQVFINYNALSNGGILIYSAYSSNTKIEQMGLKANNITEFRIANWNDCVLPIGTTVRIIGRRTSK